jgi:hypothetical protein
MVFDCFVGQIEDVDLTEAELKQALKVKPDQPPALRLLMKDNKFKKAYVVGENKIIDCQTTSILDSLTMVLAVYYVMDIHYPQIYGQVLGFLQQFLLEEPYTFLRGTNWQKFANKISNIP